MSAENTPKTILIAEDSSVILNLTRKILEQQKYKILLAKNGGDVLPQLEKNMVDGILMDINIPIKDGMQCTRDIRAHADERIRSLPLLPLAATPTTIPWPISKPPASRPICLSPSISTNWCAWCASTWGNSSIMNDRL